MGRQRRLTRPVRGAAVLGVLMLSLMGCSPGDEGPSEEDRAATQAGATEERSGSTPPAGEEDPDIESPDEDGDLGEDDGPDDAVQASGTACLVGTWLADNENVGAVIRQAAGDVNTAAPTGEVFITYSADGRQTVTYNAWTFEMSQDGVTIQVVRDGTDEGTYQATEDGRLTSTDTEMGSVVSMTTPVGTHSTPGEPSAMTGTFTCQGSTLEITVDGDTSIMTRQL